MAADAGDRLDTLEGNYERIEAKVDNLAQKVEEADWNGKGPVIRSLAELAPYLIELAKSHKAEVDDEKAVKRARELAKEEWDASLHGRAINSVRRHAKWWAGFLAAGIGLQVASWIHKPVWWPW